MALPVRFTDFPRDFFRDRELNARGSGSFVSREAIWDSLCEEQALDDVDASTASTLRRDTRITKLYFRGQSNEKYGLSTSLHRFLQAETKDALTERMLGEVEQAIIADAKNRGLGKNITDGQLLMLLQHHFAPTRLMDVSLRPLESLYFAVERDDTVDARLFVLALNSRMGRPTIIHLGDTEDLDWVRHVQGDKAAAEWTQSVQLVDDEPLDPRMVAQRGRFMVGGLQRAYETLNVWHRTSQLRTEERQLVTMLCILFPLASAQLSSKWPALGWTVRIAGEDKSWFREKLASDYGIKHESIYPELASIEWRAKEAGRAGLLP